MLLLWPLLIVLVHSANPYLDLDDYVPLDDILDDDFDDLPQLEDPSSSGNQPYGTVIQIPFPPLESAQASFPPQSMSDEIQQVSNHFVYTRGQGGPSPSGGSARQVGPQVSFNFGGLSQALPPPRRPPYVPASPRPESFAPFGSQVIQPRPTFGRFNPLAQAVAELPRAKRALAFQVFKSKSRNLYSTISLHAFGTSIHISSQEIKCGGISLHLEDLQFDLTKTMVDGRAFCQFPVKIPQKGHFLLAGIMGTAAPIWFIENPQSMTALYDWQASLENAGHRAIILGISVVSEREVVANHLDI